MAARRPGRPKKTWTEAQDKDIRDGVNVGQSMGSLARRHKVAVTTMSRRVVELGLSPSLDRVVIATEHSRAQAAKLRTELELKLLHTGNRLAGQIFAPHEYIEHGGKDFVEVRWTQPEPSPGDKRNLMQAAGLALNASLKLTERDSAAAADPVKSLLGGLARALGLIAEPESPVVEQP